MLGAVSIAVYVYNSRVVNVILSFLGRHWEGVDDFVFCANCFFEDHVTLLGDFHFCVMATLGRWVREKRARIMLRDSARVISGVVTNCATTCSFCNYSRAMWCVVILVRVEISVARS